MPRAPLYRSLYAQVLAGIALGILLGVSAPETGAAMRPLGDGFIKLIRMLIGPIVFTTIVVGLAQHGRDEGGRADRPAGRSSISRPSPTLALVIGLVVVNVTQARRRAQRRPRAPPTSRRPRATAPSASQDLTHGRRSSSTSSRPRSSTRSRAATSCRCCWSRCSPASRCCCSATARRPLVERDRAGSASWCSRSSA